MRTLITTVVVIVVTALALSPAAGASHRRHPRHGYPYVPVTAPVEPAAVSKPSRCGVVELLIPNKQLNLALPFTNSTAHYPLAALPKPYWNKVWELSRINLPVALTMLVAEPLTQTYSVEMRVQLMTNGRVLWSDQQNVKLVNGGPEKTQHIGNTVFSTDFVNPIPYTQFDNLELVFNAVLVPEKEPASLLAGFEMAVGEKAIYKAGAGGFEATTPAEIAYEERGR